MAKTIIRYNVHRSLGAGGARVGQFKTIKEAREFVGDQNLFIWKTWYTKFTETDRYHQTHYEQVF
jgi:hypothetical protein